MDEAQAKAMQEKYQRKMQHLEKGGHDTKKLRENLEGNLSILCLVLAHDLLLFRREK